MRRRRGMFKRRRPSQWVVSTTGWSQQSPGLGTTASFMLVGTSGQTGDYDNPTIQKLTVDRVRGSLRLMLSSAMTVGHGLQLWAGIIAVSTVQTGPPTPPAIVFNDQGMTSPWMWLFYGAASAVVNGGEAVNSINQQLASLGDVDVKSKRTLKGNEALMLYLCIAAGSGTFSANIYLRSLVSRVA